MIYNAIIIYVDVLFVRIFYYYNCIPTPASTRYVVFESRHRADGLGQFVLLLTLAPKFALPVPGTPTAADAASSVWIDSISSGNPANWCCGIEQQTPDSRI